MSTAQATPPTATAQIRCDNCDVGLPLRGSDGADKIAQWVCVRCRSHFFAVLDRESKPKSLARVRLSDLYFDTSHGPQISMGQKQRVEMIIDRNAEAITPERRQSQRLRKSLPITAVPVDENATPTASGFSAMLIDVSTSGIGLATLEPIESPMVVVKIPTQPGRAVQLLVDITHTAELEAEAFRIGGMLAGRLGEAPA